MTRDRPRQGGRTRVLAEEEEKGLRQVKLVKTEKDGSEKEKKDIGTGRFLPNDMQQQPTKGRRLFADARGLK